MSEKRIYSRVAFEADIVIIANDGQECAGRMLNISTGGAFIEIDPVPVFGTRLKLLVDLPNIPDRCEISCIVRWVKPGIGAGLQFEHLRPIEVWSLNKYMRAARIDAT